MDMSNDENSIGKWISILNRHCHAYIAKRLKEYNIGSGQYVFIITLYKNNGISQDKLSELLNIDKGTTARAIKKLEEEGYVRREDDPADKRAYKLYATEKAFAIKPVICEVLKDANKILSKGFTDEDKAIARRLLEKMSKNAVQYMK
jgi:DNA-binding MarR family transcriptional regulator